MSNPLADTHVALSINIFDQTQHALVRKHLTVDRLISDILREFAQELDLNRKYILIYQGRQLDPDLVIGEANFVAGEELLFSYYEPVRSPASLILTTAEMRAINATATEQGKLRLASLREKETGREFPLIKNPATIGRAGSSGNEGIDIDLSTFREGRTVSRSHARISQSGGQYHIEGLKEERPVFVNERLLNTGDKQALRDGDVIGIGKVLLVFALK